MTNVCFFNEMSSKIGNGSIKDFLSDKVTYDKDKVAKYLNNGHKFASCPKVAIDCVTGQRIADSFSIFDDGEFCWCSYLLYHIRKYNIKLPKAFLEKIGA
jgi:hypothetical protein